jgi:hypothetical protein
MVRFIENERNEFSDETIKGAWKRADGHCEKCNAELEKDCHDRNKSGCWEAHHKDGNPKNDKPENCQILCWPCHEKTLKKSFSERVEELLKKGKPTRIMIQKNLKFKKE